MIDSRKNLGRMGEQKAKEYLLKKGYRLISENWQNRFGEIDLVMFDREIVVFIEVRTKSNNLFGTASESINYKKQLQLKKMATSFLQYKKWWDKSVRFDLITIERIEDKYKLTHYQNILD